MPSGPRKRFVAPEHHRSASNYIGNEFRISAAAHPDGRIAVMLSRYPELSGLELEELLAFMRKASPLQLRRFRSTEAVGSKLDQFLQEQAPFLVVRHVHAFWARTLFALMLISWILWNKGPESPMASPMLAEAGIVASDVPVVSHANAGAYR